MVDGDKADRVPLMSDEDESENSNLLNEKNNQNGDKYDEKGVCGKHWKILLSGVGVVCMISLGVVIGALFNSPKSDVSIGRGARTEKFPYNKIRLPGNVIPIRYRVYLHPNITDGEFKFRGNVRILVETKKDTDNIILHSHKSLKIESTELFKGEENMNPLKGHENNKINIEGNLAQPKLDLLMVRVGGILPSSTKYVLHIKFKGKLTSDLEGFYKSTYKTKKGEKRYLATTHFEATGARKAFPCFDEPAMKANFSIIMVREKTHTALSNMPVEKELHRNDGLVVDYFMESVRMSTYLVAFVVSDYASLEATTKRGIKVRVWAPKDQISQAKFAIHCAPLILDYYEKFFKVDFPLPKQDLIAIPDFAAGAMENWGLITYRLTSILYDEKESSSSNKQWVAVVIAHELAHQWFGNLVTMKWWNDLWLNEGFASFVEYIGSNLINTKWQMMDQFVLDSVQNSLALDSHRNSHPISVPVHDPAQINEIFDSISYDKGASIIRMMKNFIGADAFHNGLEEYLNKYKFSNAVSDDLWECMTKATGGNINVKKVMDTWTLQMGYPVINIVRDKKDKEVAIITQEHFITDVKDDASDGKKKPTKESPFNYKWNVPLTFYFQHHTEKQRQWFHPSNASLSIEWNRQSGWLKMNADAIGFYRVNYDAENWKALAAQLVKDHEVLSEADRANLIDDAFELGRAGYIDQVQALQFTQYLNKEKAYVPFISALSAIGYIGGMLLHRPGYKVYEKYILQQVVPRSKELGWEDSGTHLQKYLRGSVLRNAVFHNDSSAVANATAIYRKWMTSKKWIPPNLRSVVYLAGIKYGGAKEWNHMFEMYKTSQYPSEQTKLMFALTDTSDKKILKKYLKMSLDTNIIRSQDCCSVIEHVAGNHLGADMAIDFVKENWDLLYKRFGHTSFDFSRLIKGVFGAGKTKEKLKEAEKFLNSHDLGSGKLAGKQSIALIRNHIKWLKDNEVNVVSWLENQVKHKKA